MSANSRWRWDHAQGMITHSEAEIITNRQRDRKRQVETETESKGRIEKYKSLIQGTKIIISKIITIEKTSKSLTVLISHFFIFRLQTSFNGF